MSNVIQQKPDLVRFLQNAKVSQLSPFFPNNNECFDFMREVCKYGLVAFEKLSIDTQFGLIATYYSIYK